MNDRDPSDRRIPDRPRAALRPHHRRSLVEAAARAALVTAYRAVQPESREPFAERPREERLPRLYYTADDGWQSPLFRVPPRPGASGEPVILAHGLGTNRYAVDFREGRSLARALRDAGFAVYLLEHRAHASAVPPADGSRAFDFDDIATLDLPAAVDAVLEHSGFSRAHWVGHAMGGQLLYGLLAHCRGDGIAAAVSLCAPVRFAARPSTTGAIRVLRHLLPRGARLPIRLTAAALSPAARGGARTCAEPAYARGVLVHATEDISGAMMRQVLQWLQSGALCDRHDRLDYAEALRGLDTPLMVLASQGDPLCPPEHAIPALDGLVGPTAIEILGAEWAHFDVLLHARAADAVYPRIVSWLDQHRRLAWES